MAQAAEASYSTSVAAKAFAKFAAQAGGEKALLWSRLRGAFVNVAAKRAPRCLDFGCGSGWLARQAAAEFDAQAVGYDPSTEMIAQARRGKTKATFCTEIEAARAEGPYDLIFSVFVTPALETKRELEKLFADAAGMLRPAGRLLVAAADPQSVFQRHAFYESHAPASKAAGARYRTDILTVDGSVIVSVSDYYWPASAIQAAAAGAGLRLSADCRLADPAAAPNPKHFAYRIWEFQQR